MGYIWHKPFFLKYMGTFCCHATCDSLQRMLFWARINYFFVCVELIINTYFFCRSQVAGHRSWVPSKSKSNHYNTGDVRITRDSQEVYGYFHATYVSLYNFNENFKFLGVVYVLTGLKYSLQTCSVTYILSLSDNSLWYQIELFYFFLFEIEFVQNKKNGSPCSIYPNSTMTSRVPG